MARSAEEIAADLDAAQLEEQGNLPEGDVDNPDNNQEEELPGFMSHEEWIAAGKDPDEYKGKNAYKKEFDRIKANREENKALSNDLKEIKGTLNAVVDAAEETRLNQLAAHKAEKQAILDEKIDTLSPKEAIEEQREIDAIDDSPKETQKINPVITTFITDNPLIDEKSDQYNAEFAADVIAYHNAGIDALSGGGQRQVTDGQIQKVMKKAFDDAKVLNKDMFVSERNNRAGPGKGGKPRSKEGVTKLSDYKIDDKGDLKNQNAAQAIFDVINAKDPEAAKRFQSNLSGEN